MYVRERMLAILAGGSRRGQELVDLVRSEDPEVTAGQAWAAMVDLQDDELITDELVWGMSFVDYRMRAHWQLTDKGRAALTA
jgi:DNA-binding PadR family transcriptional regulator